MTKVKTGLDEPTLEEFSGIPAPLASSHHGLVCASHGRQDVVPRRVPVFGVPV